MTQEKSKKRRVICWNIISLLILLAVSAFVLNGAQGVQLYSALALIFILSGIFLKRTYIFAGILIFVIVLVFTVKDSFGTNESGSENNSFNFNFFINGNK